MKIGVLALQGDFECHQRRLAELGVQPLSIRKSKELKTVSGLIIPGGESSTLLKLLTPELQGFLVEAITEGMPVLATCAGLILLAKRVENPRQESFAVLDIDVKRNAYGRQIDSCVDQSLHWTKAGRQALRTLKDGEAIGHQTVEGVFIRAPTITRVGPTVEVLIERGSDSVLVRQNNIFGATFHPELSDKARSVHELFLRQVG